MGSLVLLFLFAAACGASSSTSSGSNPGAPDGGGADADDGDGSAPQTLDDAAGPTGACGAASPIYIGTEYNAFYAVDPDTLTTRLLSLPHCSSDQIGDTPFAVTWDAKGWYPATAPSRGADMPWMLIPLETAGSNCPTPQFSRHQSSPQVIGNMTYVGSTPGASDETLTITEAPTPGSWSLATMSSAGLITEIGPLPADAWLAGSADRKIYGLRGFRFAGDMGPFDVYRIDPQTATATVIGSSTVTGPIAFARGKIFIFVTVPGGANGFTDIYAYDPVAKTLQKRTQLDFRVSRAAASSCASN